MKILNFPQMDRTDPPAPGHQFINNLPGSGVETDREQARLRHHLGRTLKAGRVQSRLKAELPPGM